MLNNKIHLIEKKLNQISDEYQCPLKDTTINFIEKTLDLKISLDFKIMNSICRSDYFSFFEFFNFENKEGIIEETLYYRKNFKLPHKYIILFSDSVSFVMLKIISESQSEVIWCDYADFFIFCDTGKMEYNPTIFPSFTDFYEFLLNEEIKYRAEES